MNNSEDLLNKICRICLCANNSRTVPLFENIDNLTCYGQAVTSCANIELPHLEYAPNNMCYSCLHQLRQCILFQKKCRNSQKYFKENKINYSTINIKENIIKQLYGDPSIIKNDILANNVNKEINNDSLRNDKYLEQNTLFDLMESTFLNKEKHVELSFEPLSHFNDNINTITKSNSINDNLFASNDDIDNDTQTGCDTNDIFSQYDDTANDTEPDLFNLIENDINTKLNKKINVKLKANYKQESFKDNKNLDSIDIFTEMEEICNNIKVDAKQSIDYSNLPTDDKSNSEKDKFNNSLYSEFDSSDVITKKASKTDFLFQTIEESFNNELLTQKQSEKSIENYKETFKIISNKKRNTHNVIKVSLDKINNKITKIKKLKLSEERTSKKNLKGSKKDKVINGNINAKKDSEAKKKKKINKNNEYTCKTCDRKFKSKDNWLRHTERHAGITAFICELCGKGFVTKSELGVHLVLTHDTGRHYPCEVCGYKAPKPYDLREHMRLHTGERPYACDQCGLTFRRLYIMRQHQLCHTEKKFQCPKCPLRFYKLSHVQAHDNNVHARRYMYACALCSRQYARNKTVRQHLTRVHQVPREKQGKIERVYISETQLSQPPLEINTNSDCNVQNVVTSC